MQIDLAIVHSTFYTLPHSGVLRADFRRSDLRLRLLSIFTFPCVYCSLFSQMYEVRIYMRTRFFHYLAGCALAVAVSVPLASAQTVTGSITGEVTDSTGAVISNAKVTAENVDTGVRSVTTSNADGVYSIRFLPIGHYKV